MHAVMAERIRLIIDTDEVNRLAVRLAAVKAGKSPSEIVNGLIRQHLAAEIRDARKYAVPRDKPSADSDGGD